MSDMNQDGGTGIVVAAVIGAAVGAGVALLFAPCSGKETRDWLARRSREIKDTATSVIEKGTQTLRKTADELGREVESGVADLRGRSPIL